MMLQVKIYLAMQSRLFNINIQRCVCVLCVRPFTRFYVHISIAYSVILYLIIFTVNKYTMTD